MDCFVKRKRKFSSSNDNESNEESWKRDKIEVKWIKYLAENLNLEFCVFYNKRKADAILAWLEKECEWNTGKAAQVLVFGKWHNIPRQQVAYGDRGLSYTFSGTTVPAKPWTPLLLDIRQDIRSVTGHKFNFVLVNRYKDGEDYIGEHRDDEKDLVQTSPIASLSFGQTRDFILRHADSRGKHAKRKIDKVQVELTHGSLLMMNYPTNVYWYHSVPVRKKATGVRINLTFRDFVIK